MQVFKGYDKEVRAILGTLTIRRLSNLFLIYGSHFFSVLFKKNLHRGAPLFVTLETTNSCNLSCPECVTGMNGLKRANTMLSAALAEKVLKDLAPKALIVNHYFQGEPLLNPSLFECIQRSTDYKLYSIISTNAQNLTQSKAAKLVKSGLGKIIISLDGITQESYGKYRTRGKLKKVLEGIENLVQSKRDHKTVYPIIEVQFIVFSFNEHEIHEAKRLAYNMGCDRFVLKTAQFYDEKRAHEWQPANPKYQRYKSEDPLQIKNNAPRGCKKMWSSMVICSGGELALCCMDKNADFSTGNILDTEALTLWKDSKMDSYRAKIAQGDYLSICNNCPLKG